MVGNSRSCASERIAWDNDLVGALMEEVHLNEVVWYIASPLYKNKNGQVAAWEKSNQHWIGGAPFKCANKVASPERHLPIESKSTFAQIW